MPELKEVGDKELIDELEDRGYTVGNGDEVSPDEAEIKADEFAPVYEMMAAGRRDDAYEWLRLRVQDATGRILP